MALHTNTLRYDYDKLVNRPRSLLSALIDRAKIDPSDPVLNRLALRLSADDRNTFKAALTNI